MEGREGEEGGREGEGVWREMGRERGRGRREGEGGRPGDGKGGLGEREGGREGYLYTHDACLSDLVNTMEEANRSGWRLHRDTWTGGEGKMTTFIA